MLKSVISLSPSYFSLTYTHLHINHIHLAQVKIIPAVKAKFRLCGIIHILVLDSKK